MFEMHGGVKMKKYILSVTIASVVILIDQITKYIIKTHFPLNKSMAVINGFFHITHVKNTGGAFSLLSGANSLFFIIASALALVIIFIYLAGTSNNKFWVIFSISLIAGGAVGNMIDRLRSGEVTDFLDFFYKGHHWPAFNIADSAITTGVFIIFIDMIFSRKGKQLVSGPL